MPIYKKKELHELVGGDILLELTIPKLKENFGLYIEYMNDIKRDLVGSMYTFYYGLDKMNPENILKESKKRSNVKPGAIWLSRSQSQDVCEWINVFICGNIHLITKKYGKIDDGLIVQICYDLCEFREKYPWKLKKYVLQVTLYYLSLMSENQLGYFIKTCEDEEILNIYQSFIC